VIATAPALRRSPGAGAPSSTWGADAAGRAAGALRPGISKILWAVLLSSLAVAPAAAQTLERIAATKTVRIGFIADQAPFASKGSNGAPAGYAIDVCGKVVAAINHELGEAQAVYIETTLADAFAAVAGDRLDLLCGAITITLGRRELVDFSAPFFLTGASAALRTDSPRDLRELFLSERTISPPRSPALRPFSASRVGVRADTMTEVVLRRAVLDGGYETEVLRYANHADGLAALKSREIDAYFADRALLLGIVDRDRNAADLVLATRLFTTEHYGIAMKRGDSDLRLLVDRSLSEFYAAPEFSDLLAGYFGDEASSLQKQIQSYAIPE
jgi:ABC-type amino acid transport substrate-binding protein